MVRHSLCIRLQVLIGAPCSNKVDMYSYGVVLWEIITGEQPRRGMLREIRCTAFLQIWGGGGLAGVGFSYPRPSADIFLQNLPLII